MSKKRKTSYKDALSTLTEVLSVREKDLDAREAQLQKDKESFDIDRSAAYGETSPSDVLHLNIGGTKTTVLRRTLTSVPGSMLASRFSGRWDDSLEKDKDGDFFIDQEFHLFDFMLSYLRNKANGNEKYPVKSPIITGRGLEIIQDFHRMVEYYGMTNGIFPTILTIHTGSAEDSEETIVDSKKVNAKEWTTFQLALDGHQRRVRTYEVTLGDVQRVQIGWKYTANGIALTSGNSLGVGDVGNTSALDLTRCTYLVNGESTPVDGLEYAKGTVVRSEDYGKVWYVNGELVAPTSKEKWDENYAKHKIKRGSILHTFCPFISIKGEMEITSVELTG